MTPMEYYRVRRPADVATTLVRPHGAWIKGQRHPQGKLHRSRVVVADWSEDRMVYRGRGWCGLYVEQAHLSIDPPDPDDVTYCDHCLFAGEDVVYRFFDIDGRLVYVGYTASLSHRLEQHRRGASWWPQVHRGTYEVFDDEETAREAEAKAILFERPLANRPPGKRRLALAAALSP
jgi:hypothetical protein